MNGSTVRTPRWKGIWGHQGWGLVALSSGRGDRGAKSLGEDQHPDTANMAGCSTTVLPARLLQVGWGSSFRGPAGGRMSYVLWYAGARKWGRPREQLGAFMTRENGWNQAHPCDHQSRDWTRALSPLKNKESLKPPMWMQAMQYSPTLPRKAGGGERWII